jgi:hypothetical protein
VRLDGYRIGVDFGTSMTVAALARSPGPATPLLFDASPLLPSAVFAGEGLLVGRDAIHAAMSAPERFEPHPKRRIDEGNVLLGDRAVAIDELIAAVLARVAAEAARVGGGASYSTVLTFPAAWGPRRRAVLTAASSRAGMGPVTLVPEPVAAAAHLTEIYGGQLPPGAPLLVYDFGAGTFDATVVRRTEAGAFEVLSTCGLDDAGGLDIDAAIIGHLGTVLVGRDAARWQRLTRPTTPADRRAATQLWDHARTAKEALSRLSATTVHVPLFDDDVPLGREQLDQLAAPVIHRTIAASRNVLRDAGVAPAEVAAIFLVGGSSRLPLTASALHRALGVAPTVAEQPELAVVQGSLRTAATDTLPASPAKDDSARSVAGPVPTPAGPPGRPAETPPLRPFGQAAAGPVPPPADAGPARRPRPPIAPAPSASPTAGALDGAPASPRRRSSRRRTVLVILATVIAVLAGGFGRGYLYVSSQYYVGITDDGYLAAFQGLHEPVAGLRPHWVIDRTDSRLDDFTPVTQDSLKQGVTADSADSARRMLQSLLQADSPARKQPCPVVSPSADTGTGISGPGGSAPVQAPVPERC